MYYRFKVFGITQKVPSRDHFVSYFREGLKWFQYDGLESKYQVRETQLENIRHASNLEHIVVHA